MVQIFRQTTRWICILTAFAAVLFMHGKDALAHDTGAAHVHAAAASFSISPVSGAAGNTVQVNGCGWSKGEDIEFYFDSPAQQIGSAVVTLAGDCFEGSIQIPSGASAGLHTIEARGSSGAIATDSFAVTESELIVVPAQGPSGSPVILQGCGWVPSDTVTIKWAATAAVMTSTSADGSGCINANGTLPSSVSAGPYVINGSDTGNSTNFSFIVTTPRLSLTPNNGPSGSSVGADGCGWLAGETVNLAWASTGAALVSPTADTDGCITGQFTVPGGQSDGDYSVAATGSLASDSNAVAPFKVQQPELLLFPALGPGGSTIDAAGCGWAGNTQVTVKWSDDSNLGTGSVNANGCFDLEVVIPVSAAVGEQPLAATGDVSGSDTKSFEVTNSATLSVSPDSAKVGRVFVVSGLGWASGETITIRWDNTTVMTTTVAPSGGSFSLVLTVPESANVATHTVNAEGDKGGSAEDTLTVLTEAGLDLFPNSLPAGGWAEACLYQWTDGERVTIKWQNGLTLKEFAYSATSDLCQTRVQLSMPGTASAPPGQYTITATGNRGHTADEQITIVADSERPDVAASFTPSITSDKSRVTILGEMTDNGGIAEAWITLMKTEPGSSAQMIKTCAPPQNKSNSEPDVRICQSDALSLEPGNYLFLVWAEDLAGNKGLDSGIIRVFKDGQPPEVEIGHTPEPLGLNATPRITVDAQDDGGIRSLFIFIDGQTYPFSYNEPYPLSVSESIDYTQTGGKRVLEYDALAFDVEGLSTRSAKRLALFDNTGPDGDNDGLSDSIEGYLCTDPNNADSDRDYLLDGWEVLGKSFTDGDHVDLPGEGANPCVRQVFLQLDWEKDTPFVPTDLQNAVNTFQDHYVRLMLSGEERPRPPVGDESSIGAFSASEMVDGNGDYFFDPKKNWTHYYGYARHRKGRSGAWGNFFTIDMKTSDQLYRLIHELGHVIGLGHGGRIGTPTLQFNSDTPYYAGEWNNVNNKPNYFSIMNYRYSGKICYNPTTNRWLSDLDYAAQSMPDLDETDLDERPSSAFIQALQNRTCDSQAGYVPAIAYSCEDPDETEPDGSNTRYVMISDGTTTLARRAAGRAIETTGLPSHPPGIDWNCDGKISSSVEENINGERPGEICDNKDNDGDGDTDEGCNNSWTPSQVHEARFDWPLVPAGRPCHIKRRDDGTYPQGLAYRTAMMGIDCSTLPSAAAQDGEDTDSTPHTDDEETLLFEELPNLEICDGIDNDGSGVADEGCLDGDTDGVIDAIDNCPLVPNSQQIDVNRNYIGDACEAPPAAPSGLIAVADEEGVKLTWSAPQGDGIDAYALYRLDPGETTYRYLGDFPTTRDTAYSDTDATPGQAYTYVVRALNRYGLEGSPSSPASINVSLDIYLPLVNR